MHEHHLRRMAVRTDIDDSEPEYIGSNSTTFRVPEGSQIVNVDWSVRGEVEITYLVRGRNDLPLREEQD